MVIFFPIMYLDACFKALFIAITVTGLAKALTRFDLLWKT